MTRTSEGTEKNVRFDRRDIAYGVKWAAAIAGLVGIIAVGSIVLDAYGASYDEDRPRWALTLVTAIVTGLASFVILYVVAGAIMTFVRSGPVELGCNASRPGTGRGSSLQA